MPTVGHLKAIDLRRSHVEAMRNYLRTAQPAEVVETRVTRALNKTVAAPAGRAALERATRARFAGKPVGIHTVRKALATLVSVLTYGVDEGVIRSNVAARVRKPTLRLVDSASGEATEGYRVTEQDILTTADFARVLEQVLEHYQLLVRLAFLTGARQGELLALQWTDLDRSKGSLRIERSWRGGEFAPPKTASSRRTVWLDTETVQDLIAWQLKRQSIHERALMFGHYRGKADRRPQPAQARLEACPEARGPPLSQVPCPAPLLRVAFASSRAARTECRQAARSCIDPDDASRVRAFCPGRSG